MHYQTLPFQRPAGKRDRPLVARFKKVQLPSHQEKVQRRSERVEECPECFRGLLLAPPRDAIAQAVQDLDLLDALESLRGRRVLTEFGKLCVTVQPREGQ